VVVNGSTAKVLTASGTPILTASAYDVRQSDTASGGGISAKIGGSASLTKTTNNSVLLSAVNTYTGSTTITAGTLSIDGDATLGDGLGNLNLNGGTLNTTANRSVSTDPVPNPINVTANSVIATTSAATTVNLNLSSNTVGGSAGQLMFTNSGADAAADTFQPRFSGNGFTMPRPIVIDNGPTGKTNLSSFNQTGTQTFAGAISGNGSYTRNSGTPGAGAVTVFTQPNTYSGGTTIADGTLYVLNTSGSGTGTGAVTINTNGTLAGTGGVTGAITSTGKISPGDPSVSSGFGTLKTGDVTSNSGGSLLVDIDVSNTPAADLLDVTGAVSLTGSTLSLTLANAPAPDESFVPQTYVIVNNDLADTVSGTFDTILVSVPGYKAVIDTAYTGTDNLGRIGDGNDIAVTVSVPEPATFGGLLLGGLGLLGRRRRVKAN
jgi:fibronectin-binding autotransporter adhesin